MSSTGNIFLNLGHLSGLGMSDFNRDDAVPQMRPGTIAWVVDAFGPRLVKYVKNVSGSVIAKGEFMAYASDGANVKTTTITASAGSTTTAIVTTGLTAGRHEGMIAWVLDDAGAAGAAPESESSIVASNTDVLVTLERDYAYTAALDASDTVELIATYQVEDAADGDEAWTCAGVVLPAAGISNMQYGWIHVDGICPAIMQDSATEGDAAVAAAASVGPFGSDGHELWVGHCLTATSTDEVLLQAPVQFKLWAAENSGGTP